MRLIKLILLVNFSFFFLQACSVNDVVVTPDSIQIALADRSAAIVALNNSEHPSRLGERTIFLSFSPSETRFFSRSVFNQLPASLSPDAGEQRLELEFRHESETYEQSNRKVIPEVLFEADEYTFTAVLPQYNQGESPDEYSDAYYNERTDYVVNPSKFAMDESVFYRWVLKNENSSVVLQSEEDSFVMQKPFTVVAIGDSFAAGEGAPEEPKGSLFRPNRSDMIAASDDQDFNKFAQWENRGSHRSKYSGFTQGVKTFRRERPQVWLEYKNFAISSSSFAAANNDFPGGILSGFDGSREIPAWALAGGIGFTRIQEFAIKPVFTSVGQIDRAEIWLEEQNISNSDVLLISLGGNDLGFGEIINAAILFYNKFDEDEVIEKYVTTGITNTLFHLPEFYEAVDERLYPTHVYWSQYPNVARVLGQAPIGLTWHYETLNLGVELAILLESSRIVGAFIGAISFPFSTFVAPAATVALYDSGADLLNASPLALHMSLSVVSSELGAADRILRERINPTISQFCEDFPWYQMPEGQSPPDRLRCDVIEVQDNNRVSIAHETRNPQFNTFINSYRKKCGGLDCSVHPTRLGYEEIYAQPVAEKLSLAYEEKSVDLNPELPSLEELEGIQIRRASSNRRTTRTKHRPFKKLTPPDEPSPERDKEMMSFAGIIAMRAACERERLGLRSNSSHDDVISVLVKTSQEERDRIREFCAKPVNYQLYSAEGQKAEEAFLDTIKKKRS